LRLDNVSVRVDSNNSSAGSIRNFSPESRAELRGRRSFDANNLFRQNSLSSAAERSREKFLSLSKSIIKEIISDKN